MSGPPGVPDLPDAPDLPCSNAARRRGDPLVGTAPPIRRWLLIEHAGAWLPEAFEGTALDSDVKRTLQAAADAVSARILLIRRAGRVAPDPGGARRWCVVDQHGAQPLTWGSWTGADDLTPAAAALRSSAAPGRPPAAPTAPTSELLLVCTHGRHDVCCAVRGRPVAAALAARWPEATWECSHVGGDRFAANLISLPDGAAFGGLDPATAQTVVAEHFAGRTPTAYLRGVCGYPPAVQAAVVAVLGADPDTPWDGVRPVSAAPDGPHRWVVRLAVAGHGVVTVRGVDDVREAHLLTCRAPGENRATVPVAKDISGLRLPPATGGE